MPKKINMIGLEFNGCRVVSEIEKINGRVAYKCVCYCGKDFKATTKVIRSGAKRSCGCARVGINKKHGLSRSSEYSSWSGMIQRCNNRKNPKFNRYGGRGIKVCDSWLSFENFISDLGMKDDIKQTIGRIDNDGDYCKENCRWESDIQQANNTSRTVKFKYRGVSLTARQVSDMNGIDYDLVYVRLSKGLDGDDVDCDHRLNEVTVTVDGIKTQLTKALEELSIPTSTFYKRKREGLTSQQIIDKKLSSGLI